MNATHRFWPVMHQHEAPGLAKLLLFIRKRKQWNNSFRTNLSRTIVFLLNKILGVFWSGPAGVFFAALAESLGRSGFSAEEAWCGQLFKDSGKLNRKLSDQ